MINALGPWRWRSARRPLDHLVNSNHTPSKFGQELVPPDAVWASSLSREIQSRLGQIRGRKIAPPDRFVGSIFSPKPLF